MNEIELTNNIKRILQLSFVTDYVKAANVNFFYAPPNNHLNNIEVAFSFDVITKRHFDRFDSFMANHLPDFMLQNYRIRNSEITLDLLFVGENQNESN